jgi:hypothetical protein
MYLGLMIMEYDQYSILQLLVSSRSLINIDSIISGSWDKTIRVFSPTDAKANTVIPVPEKVFTMDIHEYTLVVGMSGRLNYIFDIRMLDEPIQRRDSSLKFMTRCIKMTPSGDGTAPSPSPFTPLHIVLVLSRC